jgi:hypothetical protein
MLSQGELPANLNEMVAQLQTTAKDLSVLEGRFLKETLLEQFQLLDCEHVLPRLAL